MKSYIAFVIIALLSGEAMGHRHHHRHSHRQHGAKSLESSLLEINHEANRDLLKIVHDKLNRATNLIQVQRMEPACDADCKKKCDAEADTMIREMANPLNDITWNCKNNYHVFTTDYDPNHEHMDRMSMDVMDT
jgi:hypothetical protein